MSKRNVWFKRYSRETLRQQFIEIIDLLNEKDIPYHLEGGVLLGIVRDGDLLPWDNDTDLSINFEDYKFLEIAAKEIKRLGWRCKFKKFETSSSFATTDDIRVFKISDYWLGFMKGGNRMDIFIKYQVDGYRCWSAAGAFMRVDNKYYDGYEIIEWNNRKLRVPKHYREYLTEKYGDWSVPQRVWSAKSEGTVFGG